MTYEVRISEQADADLEEFLNTSLSICYPQGMPSVN